MIVLDAPHLSPLWTTTVSDGSRSRTASTCARKGQAVMRGREGGDMLRPSSSATGFPFRLWLFWRNWNCPSIPCLRRIFAFEQEDVSHDSRQKEGYLVSFRDILFRWLTW